MLKGFNGGIKASSDNDSIVVVGGCGGEEGGSEAHAESTICACYCWLCCNQLQLGPRASDDG